jgi:hypothetical protein
MAPANPICGDSARSDHDDGARPALMHEHIVTRSPGCGRTGRTSGALRREGAAPRQAVRREVPRRGRRRIAFARRRAPRSLTLSKPLKRTGPEIGESVGSRLEQNDGNRERDNVLLKGKGFDPLSRIRRTALTLARHRREPVEKVIDCIARFDAIEQSAQELLCRKTLRCRPSPRGYSRQLAVYADKITPIPTCGRGGASALCRPVRGRSPN